jgi:hypothetical protein
MGEKTNAYRLLVGKPEGMKPLGNPRRKWVEIIKSEFEERMRVLIAQIWLRLGKIGYLL